MRELCIEDRSRYSAFAVIACPLQSMDIDVSSIDVAMSEELLCLFYSSTIQKIQSGCGMSETMSS